MPERKVAHSENCQPGCYVLTKRATTKAIVEIAVLSPDMLKKGVARTGCCGPCCYVLPRRATMNVRIRCCCSVRPNVNGRSRALRGLSAAMLVFCPNEVYCPGGIAYNGWRAAAGPSKEAGGMLNYENFRPPLEPEDARAPLCQPGPEGRP